MTGYWTTFVALALERIGRRGALARLDEPEGSRFLEAALAIDEGRFADAAQVLEEIGTPQLEAEARLLAERESRARGDERGAEAHRERARALLERLGAVARLRELDAAGV